MKYQLLFAAALMLIISACGTVPVVTDQTQSDVTLESARVRTPPPPPAPVSLAFRLYAVTVVRNGVTLYGFLNITNETVPNQPGALRASYGVPVTSYLAMFPASDATVASWVPFLTGTLYNPSSYYSLPSIITLGANNSITLKTGNPDPNSLNQGVVVLNLVGQLVKPAPTPIGGFANPDLVGNPAAPGTTPVTSWFGLCSISCK